MTPNGVGVVAPTPLIHAPRLIAAQVLGHGTLATTERHYNLARGQEAAESWHKTLDGLRRTGMPP